MDIAILSEADGVHLGQDDIPPSAARRLLGVDAIIGVSTHNVREAEKAALEADYISFGPVFNTTTKKDAQEPKGLAALKAVRSAVSLPIVAIGGINEANALDVLKAGADSVAVISAILCAPDIAEKVRMLNGIFERA